MIFYSVIFLLSILSMNAEKQMFGGHSMVAPLKRIVVRRPDESFAVQDYKKWHYTSAPNLLNAQKEHDCFVEILKRFDIEIVYHATALADHADAIFVHDPIIITNAGAIILRMGKLLRRGEEDALADALTAAGVPILFTLQEPATAEAGDMVWLDETTLAIGRGFRTNDEGIKQITQAVAPLRVKIIVVHLPYDQGEHACLHLMSLISLVDHQTALVYKKFLPVSFLQYLEDAGYTLIEVPDYEYVTMGCNVLALAPKVCLMLEGNPETKKRLEHNGCTVYTYKGDEISLKAEGGATCLTRPLLRK